MMHLLVPAMNHWRSSWEADEAAVKGSHLLYCRVEEAKREATSTFRIFISSVAGSSFLISPRSRSTILKACKLELSMNRKGWTYEVHAFSAMCSQSWLSAVALTLGRGETWCQWKRANHLPVLLVSRFRLLSIAELDHRFCLADINDLNIIWWGLAFPTLPVIGISGTVQRGP